MKKYIYKIKLLTIYFSIIALTGCSGCCGGGALGYGIGNPDCNCSSESIEARIVVCRKKTDQIKEFLNSNIGIYTIIGLSVYNNNITDSLMNNNITEFIIQDRNIYKNSFKDMCDLKGGNNPDRYCLFYDNETYPLFNFKNNYNLNVMFNLIKVNENETNFQINSTPCNSNKLCNFMKFETNNEWVFKKNTLNSYTFKNKKENIILSLTK